MFLFDPERRCAAHHRLLRQRSTPAALFVPALSRKQHPRGVRLRRDSAAVGVPAARAAGLDQRRPAYHRRRARRGSVMLLALGLIGAYLVGSIPFGIIVGKGLFGVDPRTVGSGNIGAANSLRALGKAGAALVLVGDIVKGVVPTLLAAHWFASMPWVVAATGLATIAGHNWSVFLKFRGGKGVATGLGVLVVLSWKATAVFAVVWLITVAVTRYSSLASLLASLAVPIALFALRAPTWYTVYGIVAFALVLWRHAANVQRLLAGTELRIGTPKEQNAP